MDKNNNRTDLLAAGRKKLQQFRKKNNKSNKGNSSKAGKSGNDATAAASEAPAASRKYNVDSKDAISSSESIARTDSTMDDTVVSIDLLSAEANNSIETASAAVNVEFPPTLDPNADDRHIIDSEVKERDGLLLVLEDENENNNEPETSDGSASIEQSNDSVASQAEGQRGEEQVTDVGAMQEADNSNLDQIDKGGGTEIGVHDLVNETDLTSRDHVASQFTKHDVPLPIDIAISEQEEARQSVVMSISSEPETVPAITIETNDHQEEDISSGASNEEEIEVLNVSGVYGAEPSEGTQISSGVVDEKTNDSKKTDDNVYGAEPSEGIQISSGVIGEKTNDSKKTLGCKQVDLSSGLDGSLIKLSQLAEILQILDKEEFDFLFTSRQLSTVEFRDADKINDASSVSYDAFERLKEHLYVTTFSKDMFQVELSENQNLVDEISMTNVLLNQVQRKNETLNEEIEALSTEIKELHHQLEMKKVDISSLSSGIVESRNSVEALQAENESLKESFKMVTDEKDKFFEENGSVLLDYENIKEELVRCKSSLVELQTQEVRSTENLTSLRDAMMRLEEENDHIVRYNSKLLGDVEEYKSEVEALKAEYINLNETFTSVLKEIKNLEVDKELVVNQNEKLSNELIECKKLVSTLEMEISKLNESLESIRVEIDKTEEGKMNIFVECEKQSQVLAEIKLSEAGLQAECTKAVNDLKEGTFRINQLVEENESLKRNLEFFKSNSKVVEANCSGVSETLTREMLEMDVYDEGAGFVALKTHLEEAGTVMQRLENAVESMHLHFNSLRMSNDKIAPGVSRLIQAFESKGSADDNEIEEPPTENQTTEDPYRTTTMVAKDLRTLLMDTITDAENASEFCKGMMRSKLLAEISEAALRGKYESLKEHTDQAEESNVVFMILYETVRENFCQAAEREDELRILSDALQKQEMVLKSQNIDLTEKLTESEVMVNGLERKLKETLKDSEEMVASLSDQVKILEERNFIIAQVLRSVDELDAAVETFQSSPLFGTSDNHDIITRVASSISSATKVIEDLRKELEAIRMDRQSLSDVYNDMLEKNSNLQVKNDMASNTLYKLYNDLNGLMGETENVLVGDILHVDSFKPLLDHLKRFHGEKLELESANKQLNSELTNNATDMGELRKECLKVDTVMKLVEDIEQSLRKDCIEIHVIEPAFRIEYLVNLLFDKYKEAVHSLSLSTLQEMQLTEIQEQVERLNLTLMQYENENLVFKQSLKSAEQDAASLNTKIQEKAAELEQSEQRVASLREKLSIAVTKGKGLISQRDSLKHSLAESSHELLSKDTRINELESKLEVYAEAGERMEALESELSYIRNSATALRESFLLKDSVLQRVEEILEDLELPEHLYSGDIIEKVDWLAKSVAGNSLPPNEWDHRNSAGVDSHSDAGVNTVMEEVKPNPNSTEDSRPRYEDLQIKFYELAEQNEMLEQSLMERSNLVRRWEEFLDRIDLPSSLRSLEPEDKIQWLENALTEAQNQSSSLQQKIDNLESFCGSLTANVEDSQRIVSDLDSVLQQALMEKETLSRDLEIMRKSNDENSRKTADFVIRNENLQNEIYLLQEQRRKMEEDICHTEATIRRLQALVIDALKGSSTEDVVFDQEAVNFLEEMLSNLVEKYRALSSVKPADVDPVDVSAIEESERSLRKELDDCMDELTYLKEENDRYVVDNQSLVHEIEALSVTKNELQQLLSQEEQKSASVREKLNVAVRKGKSLVQQRDGMKKAIEQLNAEVERLKSENKLTETTISDNERWIKDLLSSQEKARVMQSENVFLKEHLAEKEHSIQNLRVSLDSAEQESRKSKRAAELLLAELNEVQERNDMHQEELPKVEHMLSEVSREKDLAESAKYEALARVEELYAQFEEKDRQLSEITVLKSGVDQTRQEIVAVERDLGDVLSKDLEVLHYVEDLMKSFMESGGEFELIAPFPRGFDGGFKSINLENKVFVTEVACLRERLYNHSLSLHEETRRLSEVIRNVHTEYVSQKKSRESMSREVMRLQSTEKERESELHVLHANISLIDETYTSTILEIENWMKDALPSKFPERYFKSQTLIEDLKYSTNDMSFFTEERIRGMRDKLLFVVKDFMSMQSELIEDGQREMKSTILNLQKELQAKDIQRERVCAELVSQIKEAETTAKNYMQELQQTRGALNELNSEITVMKEERETMEQRMKELKNQETNSTILQQKINSLTDALAAKEQENESLLQALDEEESQMEVLTSKIGTLENELQQKNHELENTEASRSKALKKLSVTVNKFDELHCLSENLLSEVEKLQSQLQERDVEISFLRQEVTRCTNDTLAVSQMNKKRSTDEVHDVLKWIGSLISRVNTQDLTYDYKESQEVSECKEMLQKQIMALVSELENLRSVAHNSNILLQQERTKVEELEKKEQIFKHSLCEKESQILALQRAGDFIELANATSEIVELEPMKNNWAPPGNMAQQVRSLRKTNNDQVAIAIDMDQNCDRLEEEDDDDDKAHGFKSLTTSKIVPRFTRPISDMVDGLWVSCDRALMRQPALRLGVILYWAVLHAFLAAFVV